MTEPLALPTAFFLGLLGGTHCLGMCGGIATTLSISSPSTGRTYLFLLGYNAGRILSYALAGAIIGSLGWLIHSPQTQLLLRSLAAIMLILMGLYIAQWWQGLAKVEQAGNYLWKYLSPLTGKLIPIQNPAQAIGLGILWGWLPCGLVYSTLIWSSSASNWLTSAKIMIAFGLGTLPVLLLTGILAHQIKQILQHRLTRQLSGSIIIIMGIYSLPWQGLLDLQIAKQVITIEENIGE